MLVTHSYLFLEVLHFIGQGRGPLARRLDGTDPREGRVPHLLHFGVWRTRKRLCVVHQVWGIHEEAGMKTLGVSSCLRSIMCWIKKLLLLADIACNLQQIQPIRLIIKISGPHAAGGKWTDCIYLLRGG